MLLLNLKAGTKKVASFVMPDNILLGRNTTALEIVNSGFTCISIADSDGLCTNFVRLKSFVFTGNIIFGEEKSWLHVQAGQLTFRQVFGCLPKSCLTQLQGVPKNMSPVRNLRFG